MTELFLFLSTFLAVFAPGFQSLNVNNGHYMAAFITSFAIRRGESGALQACAPCFRIGNHSISIGRADRDHLRHESAWMDEKAA